MKDQKSNEYQAKRWSPHEKWYKTTIDQQYERLDKTNLAGHSIQIKSSKSFHNKFNKTICYHKYKMANSTIIEKELNLYQFMTSNDAQSTANITNSLTSHQQRFLIQSDHLTN